MIGFLAPNGKFTECVSWGHTSKASDICKEEYNVILNGIPAEDFLLAKGYLVIRARDAYMSFWDKTSGRLLSHEQLQWLYDNVDNFNEMVKEDLNRILLDDDKSLNKL